MPEYLANIFQGRIEYELIDSLRGAKHRVDYSVHFRRDRERYLLYYIIQPKTTFFVHHLRDLRLGNHIIKYKQLNDVNRSNLYTHSYDKTSLGLNKVPPTVVLIAPVFFMNSSWSL